MSRWIDQSSDLILAEITADQQTNLATGQLGGLTIALSEQRQPWQAGGHRDPP